MFAINELREEEAKLSERLRLLPLQNPEARREAGEIRERLSEIAAEKVEIAKLALAKVERRERNRRRRQRRAA